MNNLPARPILVIVHPHYAAEMIGQTNNIYSGRFSRICHLVPFYRQDKDIHRQENNKYDIIPVYAAADSCHTAMAGGCAGFKSEDASHYIFINSNLTLSDDINEKNYLAMLGLDAKSSFIPALENLPNAYSLLPWQRPAAASKALLDDLAAYNFQLATEQVKWPPQLTNHIYAMLSFKKHGLLTEHIDLKKAVRRHKKGIFAKRPVLSKSLMLRAMLEFLLRREDSYRPYKLAYPLARGESNFCVVSSNSIENFITHCGIFAAYKLPAKIAIPTALVLTADELVLGKELKIKPCV